MGSVDFYMTCDLDFFHAAGGVAIPSGLCALTSAEIDDFMAAYMMGGEL
jgi:hypothetical protein